MQTKEESIRYLSRILNPHETLYVKRTHQSKTGGTTYFRFYIKRESHFDITPYIAKLLGKKMKATGDMIVTAEPFDLPRKLTQNISFILFEDFSLLETQVVK